MGPTPYPHITTPLWCNWSPVANGIPVIERERGKGLMGSMKESYCYGYRPTYIYIYT